MARSSESEYCHAREQHSPRLRVLGGYCRIASTTIVLGKIRVSNAIRFLETMGAAASLQTTAGYVAAVVALDVEADQRAALLDRDVASLARLLEARPAMFCMILAPDEGKEDESREDSDDQTGGEEDPAEKE